MNACALFLSHKSPKSRMLSAGGKNVSQERTNQISPTHFQKNYLKNLKHPDILLLAARKKNQEKSVGHTGSYYLIRIKLLLYQNIFISARWEFFMSAKKASLVTKVNLLFLKIL